MRERDISRIQLGLKHSGLYFENDGNFYHERMRGFQLVICLKFIKRNQDIL